MYDGQGALSNTFEWELLKERVEHGIFFSYSGFSGVLDMPAGIFMNIEADARRSGLEAAIEELNALYDGVDGVEEISFEVDDSDMLSNKLTAKITHREPHNKNDFPALVTPFVDNIIRVANENSILVSRLDVMLRQNDKNFVYYRSNNESNDNDELKIGKVVYHSYNPKNGHDDIEYNKIPSYDDDLTANINRLSELLTITSIRTSKPNFLDGVDFVVNWRNNSDKTINYITFSANAINAVGDTVQCDIARRSGASIEFTGPFASNTSRTSTETNVWWNSNIVRADVHLIKIRYADGTSEEIRNNQMGFNEWMQ
jgi:hypothetical protein